MYLRSNFCNYYEVKKGGMSMSNVNERMKQIEEESTPIECVEDIIECLESLYTVELNNGVKRLPKELIDFSGFISIALKQARLLKTKLN